MKKFMIITGAGCSAESGIPTFRDADQGLWKDFDPMVLANFRTWKENFDRVHEFYSARRQDLQNITPNAAHYKIAEWQDKYEAHVYTSNIDLLLEAAGCRKVHHVHGRIDEMQCLSCGHTWNIGYNLYDTTTGCPECKNCDNVKPNVVFFNEMAPGYASMYDMIGSMGDSGMFVSIGTSGTVIPVNEISQFLDCTTIVNILDLERDSDGYYPPISPSHWTHCFLGPATERVCDIDAVIQEWYAR